MFTLVHSACDLCPLITQVKSFNELDNLLNSALHDLDVKTYSLDAIPHEELNMLRSRRDVSDILSYDRMAQVRIDKGENFQDLVEGRIRFKKSLPIFSGIKNINGIYRLRNAIAEYGHQILQDTINVRDLYMIETYRMINFEGYFTEIDQKYRHSSQVSLI